MTKELSIEKIKKELIDNISNNSEILEYFENYLQGEEYHKHCLKEYGMKYIKDNFIFANDMSMSDNCNFISVEANEEEGTSLDGIKMYYRVIIMVTLEDYKDIDTISVLLGKIATELYPDRFSYKNTVYYHKNRKQLENRKQLARVIKFTVG
jgi:hypothetical protein